LIALHWFWVSESLADKRWSFRAQELFWIGCPDAPAQSQIFRSLCSSAWNEKDPNAVRWNAAADKSTCWGCRHPWSPYWSPPIMLEMIRIRRGDQSTWPKKEVIVVDDGWLIVRLQ
jgi:hypothetical protein